MEADKSYKNIKILYEDSHILVCVKPSGVPVQTKSMGTADMVSLLKSYLSQTQTGAPYVGVIHRLDQPVEGILVFAKTSADAGKLNRQLTAGQFGKHYLAVVCGCPSSSEATLCCYLKKDGRTNTSCVCSKNETDAKYAELSYHLLRSLQAPPASPDAKEEPSTLSLVRIELKTGRHHQIRVQFSDAGLPLWGDAKYNPSFLERRGYFPVALCAYRLCFTHPRTSKAMEFEIAPKGPGFAPFYLT